MTKSTRFITTFLALGVLCGAVGCQFNVKGGFGAKIDAESAYARAVLATANLPAADARTYIVQHAPFLTETYETSTVNYFAWAFGPAQVWTTAVIYNDLAAMSAWSRSAVLRAATQPGGPPPMSDTNALTNARTTAQMVENLANKKNNLAATRATQGVK